MSADHLLLWLSAKGEGSWSQFRSAVETLHAEPLSTAGRPSGAAEDATVGRDSDLPLYQQLRFALHQLAHVEFQSEEAERRWRVVPPTLAVSSPPQSDGLLCGARSPALLESLLRATDVTVTSSTFEGMPQRLRLEGASHGAVVARARSLGFQIQVDAPIAMLSVLPHVSDTSGWRHSTMPATAGWQVHRFSASQLRWLDARQSDAARARSGLFRFVLKHQRFYYLRSSSRCFRVPVQVGKFAVTRKRRGILTYDREAETLSALAIFRPPPLIERALVLCSGRVPRFDASTGRVEYTDVPYLVAQMAAQLLRQKVR